MTVNAEVPYLLALAELMPGDPRVDDYGVLVAAIARHQAMLMDTDVYGSLRPKAAALLQTLARLPALEAHNPSFAWAVAMGFLRLNSLEINPPPVAAAELLLAIHTGRAGIREISNQLAHWSN